MKSENDSYLSLPVLKIGVLINPKAGLGGAIAAKGSDLLPNQRLSAQQSHAYQRMLLVLRDLLPIAERLQLYSVAGVMGADAIIESGLTTTVVYQPDMPTSANDTQQGVRALLATGIELLLFAGGDGTARDICQTGLTIPVLGVPSGVKMHSGVFAVRPADASALLLKLIQGGGVLLSTAEVRDLDEEALLAGQVKPKFYGELCVPQDTQLLQQVKCASPASVALQQQEIAAGVCDDLQTDTVYVFGAGTTTGAVLAELGYDHTLLGFDAVLNRELMAQDLDAEGLLQLAAQYPMRIVLTVTGGQGILLGRGNQQLTPSLLRQLGRSALWVLATPDKLQALSGRPLRLDTGDAALDAEWQGLIEVTTGYQQKQLYYVA